MKGFDLKRKMSLSLPFFILSILLVAGGILRGLYPNLFFPAAPRMGVLGAALLGGLLSGTVAYRRWSSTSRQRKNAIGLVQQIITSRKPTDQPIENDLANAERTISRLVRNADEDLKEINPDFTLESLLGLPAQLPVILGKIIKREDALIRLGVVGTYLGETACRCLGWVWQFRFDPSLERFGFLASVLRRGDMGLDPYALGADLLTGRKKIQGVIKELK